MAYIKGLDDRKPTHKSAREILDELRSTYVGTIFNADMTKDNEALDTALAQLAELVREQKNGYDMVWDKACEHIAQKLEGKGNGRK